MKESEARIEKISYNMVLHKYIYGEYTRFATLSGPLMKIPLKKWLEVIKRGTHQEVAEENREGYEPVYGLCQDIEPASESSVDGLSDKESKYQENLDDQKQ